MVALRRPLARSLSQLQLSRVHRSSRQHVCDAAHPAAQIAFLGVLFALLGLITDSLWALAAGTAGGMLRRSRRFVRTQRYITGSVYVGLGVATAFAGSAEDP